MDISITKIALVYLFKANAMLFSIYICKCIHKYTTNQHVKVSAYFIYIFQYNIIVKSHFVWTPFVSNLQQSLRSTGEYKWPLLRLHVQQCRYFLCYLKHKIKSSQKLTWAILSTEAVSLQGRHQEINVYMLEERFFSSWPLQNSRQKGVREKWLYFNASFDNKTYLWCLVSWIGQCNQ